MNDSYMEKRVYLVFCGHEGDCFLIAAYSSYENAEKCWKKLGQTNYFIQEICLDELIPDKVLYNVYVYNFNRFEHIAYYVRGELMGDESLLNMIVKTPGGSSELLLMKFRCSSIDEAENMARNWVGKIYADKEKFADFFNPEVKYVKYDIENDSIVEVKYKDKV